MGGTGGMLSIAEAGMKELEQEIRVERFGQQLNDRCVAVCTSDVLITDHDPENITLGDRLATDAHCGWRLTACSQIRLTA